MHLWSLTPGLRHNFPAPWSLTSRSRLISRVMCFSNSRSAQIVLTWRFDERVHRGAEQHLLARHCSPPSLSYGAGFAAACCAALHATLCVAYTVEILATPPVIPSHSVTVSWMPSDVHHCTAIPECVPANMHCHCIQNCHCLQGHCVSRHGQTVGCSDMPGRCQRHSSFPCSTGQGLDAATLCTCTGSAQEHHDKSAMTRGVQHSGTAV